MLFVEVKEKNLDYMKKIPGQYLITDIGRVFYDNEDGKRVELSKGFQFIMSRETYMNANEFTLYIEMKTGCILRYEKSGPKWTELGGFERIESLINKLYDGINTLSQEIRTMNQSQRKPIRIISQSGDVVLGNNQEYTMVIWGDTKIILPKLTKSDSGSIIFWMLINNGIVDYGTDKIMDTSSRSLAPGVTGVAQYYWNPLKETWVMDLKSIC